MPQHVEARIITGDTHHAKAYHHRDFILTSFFFPTTYLPFKISFSLHHKLLLILYFSLNHSSLKKTSWDFFGWEGPTEKFGGFYIGI